MTTISQMVLHSTNLFIVKLSILEKNSMCNPHGKKFYNSVIITFGELVPKISIIVSSEKLDKLFPAATLATTVAIMGWESEMFFTF